MPKATLRAPADPQPRIETPSQAVVAEESALKFETDVRGRKIGVIKPRALLRFRLLKILGAENSRNEVLLGNAMLAFVVRQIDNDKVMVPNTERQLEALIERLDDDGLAAVAKCLVEQYGVAAADEDAETDVVKN